MDKRLNKILILAVSMLAMITLVFGMASANIITPARLSIRQTYAMPLQNPVQAFEDNSGRIYVLDYDYTSDNIKIFDQSGNFISLFTSAGAVVNAERFFLINNILYVEPNGLAKIVVYDLTGKILGTIYPSTQPIQDLYVDVHNNVYVLGTPTSDQMFRYTPTSAGPGSYLASVPINLHMCASGFGCSSQPSRIFVDSKGNIYATGSAGGFNVLAQMDATGNFVKTLSNSPSLTVAALDQQDGLYYLSEQTSSTTYYLTRLDSNQMMTDTVPMSTSGQLYSYASIARNGDILLAASHNYVDIYSQQICGNGIIEPSKGEQCDDGPGMNNASNRCDANCRLSYCGDTHVQDPNGFSVFEQCEGNVAEDCGSADLNSGSGTAYCVASTCLWDTSGCSLPPACGDHKVNGAEQCDYDTSGNPLMSTTSCANAYGFGAVGTLACYPQGSANQCKFNTAGCSLCNDGVISANEQCDFFNQNPDTPNLNGATCASVKGAGYVGNLLCNAADTANACMLDSSHCYRCGDNVCNPSEVGKCLQDCGITGWDITGNGWSLLSSGLRGSSGTVTTNDSYAMNVKAGANYILSADVLDHSGCVATLSVLGTCLSSTDYTPKNCFSQTTLQLSNGAPTSAWRPLSAKVNLPAGRDNDSTGYYNGVKIQIMISSCADAYGIDIDNVSLKQDVGSVHYDYQPPVTASGGCCPQAYCWNGTSCRLADDWMNHSQIGPVWNLIFDPNTWPNNHVMSAAYANGTGFRCILDDNGTASWQLSDIKYDWSSKESGYCDKRTDCFVSHTFNGLLQSNQAAVDALIQSYGNHNSECVNDGMSVNDDYSLGGGNHYCYQGNWTTKSYIIANVLENFSVAQGNKQYIIFCDNDTKYLFNYLADAPPINTVAGCVMIMKHSGSEQVIVGYAMKQDDYSQDATHNIITHYNDLSSDNIGSYISLKSCIETPSGSQFYRCSYSNSGIFAPPRQLQIYYNNESHYWLISNDNIDAIDPNFVQSIVNWFKGWFGYTAPDYSALSHVSNYNKLYILSNSTLTVSSVDELKYDEINKALYDFLYLNYTGTNSARNVINLDYITAVTTPVSPISNSYGVNYQQILIKTNNTLDVWEYLTAMLRDRDIVH